MGVSSESNVEDISSDCEGFSGLVKLCTLLNELPDAVLCAFGVTCTSST